jgi:PBP1b-binding outer membrane lipoprotein LpoB
MKKLAAIAFCMMLLTGCSSGRSADELQTLVDLAKTTGAIQELKIGRAHV